MIAIWLYGTTAGLELVTVGSPPVSPSKDVSLPHDIVLDEGEIWVIRRERVGDTQALWVGLMRPAFEINYDRRGSFYGAGAWLFDCIVDASRLSQVLTELSNQIKDKAQRNGKFIKRLQDIDARALFTPEYAKFLVDTRVETGSGGLSPRSSQIVFLKDTRDVATAIHWAFTDNFAQKFGSIILGSSKNISKTANNILTFPNLSALLSLQISEIDKFYKAQLSLATEKYVRLENNLLQKDEEIDVLHKKLKQDAIISRQREHKHREELMKELSSKMDHINEIERKLKHAEEQNRLLANFVKEANKSFVGSGGDKTSISHEPDRRKKWLFSDLNARSISLLTVIIIPCLCVGLYGLYPNILSNFWRSDLAISPINNNKEKSVSQSSKTTKVKAQGEPKEEPSKSNHTANSTPLRSELIRDDWDDAELCSEKLSLKKDLCFLGDIKHFDITFGINARNVDIGKNIKNLSNTFNFYRYPEEAFVFNIRYILSEKINKKMHSRKNKGELKKVDLMHNVDEAHLINDKEAEVKVVLADPSLANDFKNSHDSNSQQHPDFPLLNIEEISQCVFKKKKEAIKKYYIEKKYKNSDVFFKRIKTAPVITKYRILGLRKSSRKSISKNSKLEKIGSLKYTQNIECELVKVDGE